MKFIFFFFTIPAIIWEFYVLGNTSKIIEIRKTLKEFKASDKTLDDLPSNYQALMFFTALYVIWAYLGLFSSQWIGFLFFVLMSRIPKFNNKWLTRIDAFLSILILLFLAINSVHLHIDLFEVVKSWFLQ